MNDDIKDSETSNDVYCENKPRLEPTGKDEDVQDVMDDEEKSGNNAELDSLNMFAKELNDKDRLIIYEKAVRLKRKGNHVHALQCFLCCLQGLQERNNFPVLPDCLHHIADIYYTQEDYKTAIQFAQAEKLYYETALITSNRDGKPECLDSIPYIKPTSNDNFTSEEQSFIHTALTEEAKKADEYEKLAHMCLKQKNPQLSLDYCAKAVKLQQACYGEHHPITLQTLDLFTVIYAEMGKQQYKAAMEKFATAQENDKQAKQAQNKQPKQVQQKEKQSITEGELTESSPKQENNIKPVGDGEEKKENQNANLQTEDAVQITLTSSWAMVLYLTITVFITLVMTAMLCYFTQTDIRTTYSYIMTRLRFYYYYYFQKPQPSGNQYL